MATTVSNSFALWGSYITEFVADVAGDEPTEEEIAAAEKQKWVVTLHWIHSSV